MAKPIGIAERISAALQRWRPRPAKLALVDDGSASASLSLEKYRSPTMLGIIGSNLLLLWGLTLGEWSTFSLFVVVWVENLIILALTLLRALLARPGDLRAWGQKIFGGPIILAIFGYFASLQAGAIYVVFSGRAPGLKFFQAPPNDDLLVAFTAEVLELLPQIALIAAFRLFALFAYILKGEYKHEPSLEPLIKIPLNRFLLVHLSIPVCGQTAIMLGTPLPAVVALLLLKFTWEVLAEMDKTAGARGVSR